jgi:hypothetical protein
MHSKSQQAEHLAIARVLKGSISTWQRNTLNGRRRGDAACQHLDAQDIKQGRKRTALANTTRRLKKGRRPTIDDNGRLNISVKERYPFTKGVPKTKLEKNTLQKGPINPIERLLLI